MTISITCTECGLVRQPTDPACLRCNTSPLLRAQGALLLMMAATYGDKS